MNQGYSGKPLVQKLGIKSGMAVGMVDAPAHYRELLGTLPDGVVFRPVEEGALDVIHLFVTSQNTLADYLPFLKIKIVPNGMIWVSWYKKSAKIPTDVTEDTIRDLALTMSLVDVKVCAVDEMWSGLKLVIRLKDRYPMVRRNGNRYLTTENTKNGKKNLNSFIVLCSDAVSRFCVPRPTMSQVHTLFLEYR